jgi:predicted AAA+ superfamily ATPase
MIKREIATELRQLAKSYPIVTIIGPRQSGKTTLAKTEFSSYKYCSLENPDLRQFAQNDPRAFLKEYSAYVIFDEIQRVPELLSYLQEIVDNKNEKGLFILTGSHQLKLRAEITQSLAGRTAILTLLPLTINEVLTTCKITDRDELIYRGFFPRIYNDDLNPTKAFANYYQTYIERDVRQLIQLKNISLFEKFLKLLAGRVGQVVNLSSLSNDVGVTSTTLQEWLSVLEASFIIFKLEPYYENFGKRVIKSSKIYFTDTGLLAYLLDLDSSKIVGRDPLIGNIFENLVLLELLKSRLNCGLRPNMYFFRDTNGNEVDIIFKQGAKLVPIEIKSSSTFNKVFTKGIYNFQKISSKATKGIVIYNGDFTPDTERYQVINFLKTYSVVSQE